MDDRQQVGSIVFSWAHSRAHSPAADRAAADISRDGCPWPEASRAGLNAGAHAVKACALPFSAGRDLSLPAQGPGKVMKLGRDLGCHNCRDVPGGSEGGGRGPGGTMEALTLAVVCHEGRPPVHAIFLSDGCCPQPVPS